MGIEKGERLAGFDGFHPQGGLAQLDGEGVAVNAIDAVPHHFAQRMLARCLAGSVGAGFDSDDLIREPAGGGEQEMA